jgi:anti-sigma factor RsiW
MNDTIHIVSEWDELSAWVDNELSAARSQDLEVRLAQSPPLRGRAAELRRLRVCTRQRADYYRAPRSLRVAVRAAGRPHERALQSWFAWRPMASGLVLAGVLALAGNLVQSTIPHTDQLQDEIVASHVRATRSQRLVDVASSDRRAVAPYLSARLDFAPPVHDLSIAGSSLVGGRVDYVDGRAVAAVVYRLGEHVVDAFAWPTANGDSGVTQSTRRGYRLARWSRNGLAHCLISDVSAEQFAAIVRQLDVGTSESPSS